VRQRGHLAAAIPQIAAMRLCGWGSKASRPKAKKSFVPFLYLATAVYSLYSVYSLRIFSNLRVFNMGFEFKSDPRLQDHS